MTSPCVVDGILQLSAVSAGVSFEAAERRSLGALYIQVITRQPGEASPLSALRIVASFQLIRTKLFLQDVPGSWRPTFYGGDIPRGFALYSFTDVTQRQIWFGVITLMSRLGQSPVLILDAI